MLVEGVVPDQPADGLLQRGDVILAVDDEPLDEPGEIRTLLQAGGPGSTHELSVEREVDAPPVEVELTTAAAPDDPDRAVVGIIPRERIVDVELPFDISVESDDVKGPSAGLAFTLAILDHLSPGELTGGKDVAVTGTMDLAGNVGPVGGAVQKAVAVRDGGFDAFLVPSAEFDEVEDRVGREVEVVAVDTLDEALAALCRTGRRHRGARSGGPAAVLSGRWTAGPSAACAGHGRSIGEPWPMIDSIRLQSPARASTSPAEGSTRTRFAPFCTRWPRP